VEDIMYSIHSLETKVFELEEIRIVIRGPEFSQVKPYDYERQYKSDGRIKEWLESRLKPLIGNLEVTVISGDGTIPHPRLTMERIRSSYTVKL